MITIHLFVLFWFFKVFFLCEKKKNIFRSRNIVKNRKSCIKAYQLKGGSVCSSRIVEQWSGRKHGEGDFWLKQILSGRGNFSNYEQITLATIANVYKWRDLCGSLEIVNTLDNLLAVILTVTATWPSWMEK